MAENQNWDAKSYTVERRLERLLVRGQHPGVARVAPGTSGFDAAMMALSASSVVGSMRSPAVPLVGLLFNVILHLP